MLKINVIPYNGRFYEIIPTNWLKSDKPNENVVENITYLFDSAWLFASLGEEKKNTNTTHWIQEQTNISWSLLSLSNEFSVSLERISNTQFTIIIINTLPSTAIFIQRISSVDSVETIFYRVFLSVAVKYDEINDRHNNNKTTSNISPKSSLKDTIDKYSFIAFQRVFFFFFFKLVWCLVFVVAHVHE